MSASVPGGPSPVASVERMMQLWESHVFDLRGPHEELLSLVATSMRTLLHSARHHEQRVAKIESHVETLDSVASTVARCNSAVDELAEARKRIDFLWASQGLSSLEISKQAPGQPSRQQPNVAAAQQQMPSAAGSRSYGTAASPAPELAASPGREVDPRGAQLNASLSRPPAGERLDAASEALRRSVMNQQMLQRASNSGVHDRQWQTALDHRLGCIEDVLDGVFGVARQLEAQTSKIMSEVDGMQRFCTSLETRVSVNAEALKRSEEQSDSALKQLAREIDRTKMRTDDAATQVQRQGDSFRQAVADWKAIEGELARVRSEVPSAASVQGMLAKALSAVSIDGSQAVDSSMTIVTQGVLRPVAARLEQGQHQLQAAIDSLYLIFDVSRSKAEALLTANRESPSTSEQLHQAVHIVHAGLPFRTVISGLQRLQKEMSARSSAVASSTAPGPSQQRPRLGLRLRDTTSSQGPAAVVDDVVVGSLAEVAGVKVGDAVLAVSGHLVRSRAEFEKAFIQHADAGAAIALQLRSPGEAERTVTLL